MPSVSILLPVHNGDRFLTACLASIRAQSLLDWELIAVNDGSTDGTAALLTAAAREDPRISILTTPHRGIVAALNAGLDACRGTFVARMDADDRMHAERLARQRAWLDAHPELDLVGCHVAPRPLDGPLKPGVRRYSAWLNSHFTSDDLQRALFVESPLAHSTFFARRDLYARLGGYRDLAWPEDYDLLLRAVAASNRLGVVPEVLLERGDWAGRVTRTDPRCSVEGMDRARLHHVQSGPWRAGRKVAVLGHGPVAQHILAGLPEASSDAPDPLDLGPEALMDRLGSQGSPRPQDWLLLLCYRNRNLNIRASEALAPFGWRDGVDVLRLR